MRRLKIYTVHIKPEKNDPYEAPLFVKEGFNVWAFFLTGFWTLYHRLWWPSAGIFAANVVLDMLVDGNDMSGMLAVQLGINLIVGFQANDWLRAKLRKRGYIITDIVTGENTMSAQQRFFDRYALTRLAVPHAA